MVYRLRVTLSAGKEQVFRDLELTGEMSLEDLHNAIMQSFGFDGMEMASFYTLDDELNLVDEIPLFPIDEALGSLSMDRVLLEDILGESNDKLAYVYDFLNMWQFLVELMETVEEIPGESYPRLVYSYGSLPDSPPEVSFDIENLNDSGLDEDFRDLENPFNDFYDYDPGEWE